MVRETLMVLVIMKFIVWEAIEWVGWGLEELLTLSQLEDPSQIFFVEWQGAKNGTKMEIKFIFY